jgi:hypothetical protein
MLNALRTQQCKLQAKVGPDRDVAHGGEREESTGRLGGRRGRRLRPVAKRLLGKYARTHRQLVRRAPKTTLTAVRYRVPKLTVCILHSF